MRSYLLLIASAVVLGGCSSNDGSATTAGAVGGTVIIAPPTDAAGIFPPFVNEGTGRLVQDLVFDRLADINASLVTLGDKSFTPRLAQKWSWAPDSMSIAFSLDPRARWHDGKPVTASDVRYSFNVFMDPIVGSPVAPLMANVDSISVRDSLTAVAWFKRHTPEQFYDLAYNLIVFPEHVYGGIPADQLHTSDATRTAIGSGPFRFVKWETGRLELIADTANYRGRPKLDRVILAAADAPTAATQMLAGQTDFMEAFPIDQVPKLDSSPVARPIIEATRGYVFMAMNAHAPKAKNAPHPIFSDIRVRRALSMAVDRVAMLQNVFGSTGLIGHGPFPMVISYADSTIRIPAFDTTAAKAMLDSSGWRVGSDGIRAKNGKPLHFVLSVPGTSLFRRRYGVLMQEQFRKIGAQVDLDIIDGQTVILRQGNGDFDALLASFGIDPSPAGAKQLWSTSGIGPTGGNFLHYSNPKVDALLDSATASFDPAKTKTAASRAMQAIADDAPAIWLYDLSIVLAVNRRIDVPPLSSDGWWMDLPHWSIPASKRIDRDRIGLTPAKP